MQEPTIYDAPITSRKALPHTHSSSQRRSTVLLSILIIAFVGGGLFWVHWAALRGVTLGYPRPKVHILNEPAGSLQINTSFQFSAAATGRDITYSWNFGDGSNATGQHVSHTYSSNGAFNVTVTASDPLGQTSQATTNLQVIPPKPSAQFTYSEPYGCCYIYFDASNSTADPSTSIASYNWNFGDGNTDSASSSQYEYTYNYSGTYQVTLVVTDATGQQSDPYTMEVTVN